MIKTKCFTKEWIDRFRQQKHLKRINPPVLEKMIQALSLLQQIKAHGLEFTFKGRSRTQIIISDDVLNPVVAFSKCSKHQ